jgi:hypothetical protein
MPYPVAMHLLRLSLACGLFASLLACPMADGPDGGVATERYPGPCTAITYADADETAVSAVVVFTYDDGGDQVTERVDTDLDGVFNISLTHAYDDDHRRVRTTREDSGALLYRYTFDADGRVALEEREDEDTGVVRWRSTFAYTGDNPTREERDIDASGTVDVILTRTFEGDLEQVERYDADADGEPDRTFSSIYDSFGNRLKVFRDNDLDGSADSVMVQSFSCWFDG